MKKTSFLFVFCLMLVCLFTLCACGEKTDEEYNEEDFTFETVNVDVHYSYSRLVSYRGKGGVVRIPQKTAAIASGAFDGCDTVTELILPGRSIQVEENAFSGCTGLEKATMQYKFFKMIPKQALREAVITDFDYTYDPANKREEPFFRDFPALEKIVLETDKYSISAFENCHALREVVLSDTITEIGNKLFYSCENLNRITAPGVTTIAADAFNGCVSLSEISLPKIVSIQLRAFSHCSSLKNIYFGKSLNEIVWNAFLECDSIMEIVYAGTMAEWDAVEKFIYWDDDMGYASVRCSDGVLSVIPFEFTLIGDGYELTRYKMRNVVSDAVIPSEYYGKPVVSIGSSAFSRISGVRSVTIPDTVTEIGEHAFDRCYALSSVVIPDSVVKIGVGAFGRCSSLTSIVIGSSVREIGDMPFIGCEKMVHIVNKSETPFDLYWIRGEVEGSSLREKEDYTDLFEIVDSESAFVNTLSVDENGVQTYTVGDKKYLIGFTGDGDLDLTGYDYTDVFPHAIERNEWITSVALPGSADISYGMFYGCSRLRVAQIGEGVKNIEPSAFGHCGNLVELHLPLTTETIQTRAFDECPLETVYVPPCTPEIDDEAFLNGIRSLEVFLYGTEADWNAIKEANPWIKRYERLICVHYLEANVRIGDVLRRR